MSGEFREMGVEVRRPAAELFDQPVELMTFVADTTAGFLRDPQNRDALAKVSILTIALGSNANSEGFYPVQAIKFWRGGEGFVVDVAPIPVRKPADSSSGRRSSGRSFDRVPE